MSALKSLDGKTLFEAWHDHKANLHFLHTFGWVVHGKDTCLGLKKLEDRNRLVIFVMDTTLHQHLSGRSGDHRVQS